MDLTILTKRMGKIAADNSPAILTAIGVTGTLTTAYLAAKGAFKSAEVIADAEEKQNVKAIDDPEVYPLTTQEKIELTWKNYLPAATSAVLTVTAIICANRISDRRTAAMASAYSIVEKSYAEYRAKTLEKTNKTKEQAIRDEIAQDRINANPVSQSTIILTKGGSTLCEDAWNNRYFTSSRNIIDKAVNDFNASLLKQDHLSLSEFWHLLGIPSTSNSDNIGWRSDRLLELDWSAVIDENDEPALSFAFRTLPDPRFASAY